MIMNKKFALSKVTTVMLILLVAVLIYVFGYFTTAQSTASMLRSEIALHNTETSIYQEYLADPSPLEADIQALQQQIDEMKTTAYTNDSNVSFKISDAIQRYRISLASVSLESATTYKEHRALPITLNISGELEDILKFIEYFENNQEGSYLVRGSSIEVAGNTTNASLVIYLCTPNV